MMRVTDLEKFALEEIWRPYQNMIGYEERLERLPVDLEETARLLEADTGWSRCVLNRIEAVGITFPDYVQHPLVDVFTGSAVHKEEPRGCPTPGACSCPSPWMPRHVTDSMVQEFCKSVDEHHHLSVDNIRTGIAAALSSYNGLTGIKPGPSDPPSQEASGPESTRQIGDKCLGDMALICSLEGLLVPITTLDALRNCVVSYTRPSSGDTAGLPYGIIDPDYAKFFTDARLACWGYGYALAMHGSFTRDLDLIAMPWTDAACDAEKLIQQIEYRTEWKRLRGMEFSVREHGRMVWTLTSPKFNCARFVDFPIVPRIIPSTPKENNDEARNQVDRSGLRSGVRAFPDSQPGERAGDSGVVSRASGDVAGVDDPAAGSAAGSPGAAGLDFVIRKGGYFYRPNAQGYTSSIHEAGRYSKTQAEAHAKSCKEVSVRPVSDFLKVPQLEPWRAELEDITSHLGAAIMQSTDKDDQIIMDHVKAAHEIAKIVRRKA